MKKIITIFITIFLLITFNPLYICAQDLLHIGSVQVEVACEDKTDTKRLESIKNRDPQFGVSLRASAVNLIYKQNLNRDTRLRASLRMPQFVFSQVNNRENIAFRNLGLAFGFEKNIATSRFIDIYGGTEIGANIDVSSNYIWGTFIANAIAGVAVKISDNMCAFGEIQSGLELRGRNNFRDKHIRSSSAFNLGVMWKLNS